MYLEVYEHELGAIRSIAKATPQHGEAMDMLVPMDDAQREMITGFRDQGPRDNVFIVNEPAADPVSRTMLTALGEPLETSVLGTYPFLDNQAIGSVVVTAREASRGPLQPSQAIPKCTFQSFQRMAFRLALSSK